MKFAMLSLALAVSSSIALAQERPAAPREAGQREAAATRPPKPPQEFLQTKEWAQLVEAIVTQCPGNVNCAADILSKVLSDPNATPAMKDAATHLMNRVKGAQEALTNAKDDAERARINEGMRGRFIKSRMAAAQNEEEQARIAARREVEAGRMSEEQFNERMAKLMAAREELRKRLHGPEAPRAPGAPGAAPTPAPRPQGGGTRG